MDSAEPLYSHARARAAAAVLAMLLALGLSTGAHAATGDITTFAGNGVDASTGDGGPATSASVRSPIGVVVAGDGSVVVAESTAHVVRRIAPNGTITTIAGTVGSSGFGGDGGPATSAQLNTPTDVAVDGAGNVFIADRMNHRVRVVGTTGTITTFAGTGTAGGQGDGGAAALAQLNEPIGLEFDSLGNLYIANRGNSRVRRVSSLGIISGFAGSGITGFAGDGNQATSAWLNDPTDMVAAPSGEVFITDRDNNRVRRVNISGVISTVAGTGTPGGNGDGGLATSAQLANPAGIEIDASGALYVAEGDGHRVRRFTVGGNITRIAGTGLTGFSGDGGPAVNAQLDDPERIAMTPDSHLLIADMSNRRVRRVESVGPKPAPTLTSTSPASPSNQNTFKVIGSAPAGTTVRLYTTSDCSGAAVATGTAAQLASPGLDVTVAANSTTVVRATADDGGGASACSTSFVTYVEDSTAPPTPSLDSSPPSPSSDANPSWSFSDTESGVTFECRLDRGGTQIFDWAACTSAHSYNLSAQIDGTYTFAVRAVDAAGNRGSATTSNYVFDRSVPTTPTITSGPGITGNGRNPSWSFSSPDSGVTFECRLDRGGTQIAGWAACTSPRTYNLTALPDGTYTFSVRAKNVALTNSPAATDDYILDTAAPAAPSIDSSPASPGNSRTPAWSFSGEAGASFECRLERGGTLVFDWAGCSSPHTFNLAAQPDGGYTFSVRAVDAAGNRGSASTSGYTLDTTAPGAPSIDSAPSSPSSGRGPEWAFTAEPATTVECRLERGGTTVSDWAACSSPRAYDLSGQPDGSYTFLVRARDAAGNTGAPASSGYVLDTTPGALSIDSAPGPLGRDARPSWSFSGEDGATFACRLARGGDTVSDWAPCVSPWTADLSGQPDATYTFFVRSTDRAGNAGDPLSRDYTLDTTAPPEPALTSTPPARARDRAPSWTFSGEEGAGFECRVDRATAVVADWAPCDGSFSANLTGLEDGPYTFAVRAVDGAGNTSGPVTGAYRLDTTPPDRPRIESSPGREGDDRTPRWGFRAEGGATLECRLTRGGGTVFEWERCDSPQSYDLRSKPDGEYRFAVKATDAAGNKGAAATDDYELSSRAADTNGPGGDAPGGAPSSDGPAPASTPADGPDDRVPASAPPGASPDDDSPSDNPVDRGGDAAGGRGDGPASSIDTPGAKAADGGAAAAGGEGDGQEASGESKRGGVGKVAHDVTRQLGRAVAAIAEHPDKTVFPLSLIFIVGGFVVLQGRMDRNDPKLALAPVFADPDLDFGPYPEPVRSGDPLGLEHPSSRAVGTRARTSTG